MHATEEINTVSIVNYRGTKVAIYYDIIIQYARPYKRERGRLSAEKSAAICPLALSRFFLSLFFSLRAHQPFRQLLAVGSIKISTLNLYTIRPQ